MDPRLKKALYAGTGIMTAAQLIASSVQVMTPAAYAQSSFPTTAVTGSEIIQNEANPTSGFFTTTQMSTFTRNLAILVSPTISGHMSVTGTAATVTNCGSTPSISGTDMAGRVTFGTGSLTSCTINFASAYVSAPYCVLRHETNSSSTNTTYLASVTNVVLTQTATSGGIVDYICIAPPGG